MYEIGNDIDLGKESAHLQIASLSSVGIGLVTTKLARHAAAAVMAMA
jgi:hypothetical protein